MATMTISEAYYVFEIVCAELQDKSHLQNPVSSLKGYDIVQICTALKLKIANDFLLLTGRHDFEERLAEIVKHHETGPGLIVLCFVPDDQVDAVGAKRAFDFEDPRYLSQETADSFARYCQSVGPQDPIYWQKIYTRLGLEYTSTSPKGNDPAPPESRLDDSGIKDHYYNIVSASIDVIAANAPHIGDCSILPYPKKTTLYAIHWLMDHWERRRETAAAADEAPIDRCRNALSFLLTHLARDWHYIEPGDKDAIAELNKCGSFPDWALPLRLKYINDETASDEAFDVHLKVVTDWIEIEKQHASRRCPGGS